MTDFLLGLSSIEALIDQTKEVEHIRGYFKWVG